MLQIQYILIQFELWGTIYSITLTQKICDLHFTEQHL